MEITKELIQNIGKIFENGLEDEYLSRSIGKVIEHEREKTFEESQLLLKDLSQFERKYNIYNLRFEIKNRKSKIVNCKLIYGGIYEMETKFDSPP